MQDSICVRFASHSLRNRNADGFAGDARALHQFITCKVGCLSECATLEAARNPNQIGRGHALTEWIFSWSCYFSLNYHGCGINFAQIAMNKDAVFGRKQDIVFRITREGLLQIHADYFELAILSVTKYLRIVEFSFSSCSA